MASFISLPSFQSHLLQKSSFLGETHLHISPLKPSPRSQKIPSTFYLKPTAKFDLFEIMGGRGLCNGEKSLQEELKRTIETTPPPPPPPTIEETPSTTSSSSSSSTSTEIASFSVPENAFEKELLGLTGGFPGGEKGLKSFIEKNPPPKKSGSVSSGELGVGITSSSKPKPPELPLLMPGMIAIVKNPKNPFYMYCGIIQRITDGKAGVLFEGGNWDKLITFQLDELERRDKGPPMVNPKSAVLEPLVQKESS
ncbi:Protein of unknown function DUF3252 [Macleaya cordata]|uniref:NAD(P)H-quinone oxidoreductase subunit S n=1 Tax=Macleaya cordata TaxID=56857 RepID=A0A200R1J6_MACCD|nr:Protein of unknown function DUF3252 [Macleaya cordata]